MAHRAGVLGKPIAHSLSPALHNAGYAAAGLVGWTYTAHECAEGDLAGFVAGLGPEWAGLSLTMPLKQVATSIADTSSDLVAALGAANTLVLRDGARRAENTDAPGMVDALRGVGKPGVVAVLGAGGTARAALAAAATLKAGKVVVYARRPGAVWDLRAVAERLGVAMTAGDWRDATVCGDADVVVSTVPAGAADALAPEVSWRRGTTLLDVRYEPWPTPLARSAAAAGCRVVDGFELLVAQAARQFELFTGVPAPVAAMRAALPRGRR